MLLKAQEHEMKMCQEGGWKQSKETGGGKEKQWERERERESVCCKIRSIARTTD